MGENGVQWERMGLLLRRVEHVVGIHAFHPCLCVPCNIGFHCF